MVAIKTGVIKTIPELDKFISTWNWGSDMYVYDTELTGLRKSNELLGITLYDTYGDSVFVYVDTPYLSGIPINVLRKKLQPIFNNGEWLCHNGYFDQWVLMNNGFTPPNVTEDSMVEIHLVNNELLKNLETRVKEDFGYPKPKFDQIVGKKWDKIDWILDTSRYVNKKGVTVEPLITHENLGEYAAQDGFWTYELHKKYNALLLEDEKLTRLYRKIEIPIIQVLVDMKFKGVGIDTKVIEGLDELALFKLKELEYGIYETCETQFNIGSSKQLGEVLYEKLKYPIPFRTPKGAPSTDKHALEILADKGYPVALTLKEHSKISTLHTGFIQAIPRLLDKDKRLRGSFSSTGTESGRFCIEENQRVLLVGEYKAIKDVEVGDLAYCFDNKGKPTIRKVLNKWDKGESKLVSVNWQSSGNRKLTGSVKCTANHRVLVKHKGWVEAQNLVKGDVLYHLMKRDHIENGNNRPRLYGTNNYMDLEQRLIKTDYFKAEKHLHIHHVDEDTTNNKVSNLEILTHEEHTSHHAKLMVERGLNKWEHLMDYDKNPPTGENHCNYKKLTRMAILRMLIESKGRPTYVDMDFDTFKTKCYDAGINLTETLKRFGTHGFVNKGMIINSLDLKQSERLKFAGVGYYRYNEIKDYYGITNHVFTGLSRTKSGRIYDIEVEDFNNFICEEICVHNSSNSPNLQNMPNDNDLPVRRAFVPKAGHVFVTFDYSQIEPRCLTHVTKDPALTAIYMSGGDIYQGIADEIHITRKAAKVVVLAIMYGLGTEKLADSIGVTKAAAAKIIDDFYTRFGKVKIWKTKIENRAMENAYCETMFGRKRRLPHVNSASKGIHYSALRQAVNTTIQGSAADIMKLAMIKTYEHCLEKYGLKPLLLTVHD